MNERGENGCNGAHAAADNFSNNGQQLQQQQQRCSGGSVLIPLSRTKRTEQQSNDVNCNQNPSLDEITYSGDRPKKI